MPADPEEVECPSNETSIAISKAGLDDVKEDLCQQLRWQTGYYSVRVLGVSQSFGLSNVELYLFLEGFDRVFTRSVGGTMRPNLRIYVIEVNVKTLTVPAC